MTKLSNSNPEKWGYDLHTRIKHQILMSYLDPWTAILGRSAPSLAYVDAFAGRGRYTTGEAGSPLLTISTVINAMNARHVGAQQMTFHFVERDIANFKNLEQELAAHGPAQDPRVRYTLYHAPFSKVSEQIVAEIRQAAQPSFFFVDPFGYDDPTMDALGRVLALPKAEVIVNLMYDFATRAVSISNPALARTLDGLFGVDTWRHLSMLSTEERERAFVRLYGEQLKARGAAYVLPSRMGDDDRARTLYYLLHATKHIKGAQVMKDAMVASGTPGILGYGGAHRHQLTPLFHVDAAQLPALLMERFRDHTRSFTDVIAATFEETGTCREPEYRTCLKDLERAGTIVVQRISSKTARGLGGEDRITFARSAQPVLS